MRSAWSIASAGIAVAVSLVPVRGSAAEFPRAVDPNPRAYVLFNKKCTSCHVSVADPERPGKTRDEWFRVVRLMEGHGFRLTDAEAGSIVDHLYSIRPAPEKDGGVPAK